MGEVDEKPKEHELPSVALRAQIDPPPLVQPEPLSGLVDHRVTYGIVGGVIGYALGMYVAYRALTQPGEEMGALPILLGAPVSAVGAWLGSLLGRVRNIGHP
jgi:hypothetical protein